MDDGAFAHEAAAIVLENMRRDFPEYEIRLDHTKKRWGLF